MAIITAATATARGTSLTMRDNPSTPTTTAAPTHPDPVFVAHKFSLCPSLAADLGNAGTVLLWKFRPEWQHLSKESGYAHLSKTELARVKSYPSSAFGKRFAVSRATLREILSHCLDCRAADVPLDDDSDGRARIADASIGLSIAMAYAGIWVIAAVTQSRVGVATSAMPRRVGTDINTARRVVRGEQRADDAQRLRCQVRHASLTEAAGNPGFAPYDKILHSAGPALLLEVPQQGWWHLVDLPMPGVLLASIAVAGPVATLHAFGWPGLSSQR